MMKVFRKLLTVLITGMMLVGMGSACAQEFAVDPAMEEIYENAQTSFENGSFREAYEAFESLGDYQDSPQMAKKSLKEAQEADYQQALSLYEQEDYENALALFEKLDGYRKSRANVKECKWRLTRQRYLEAKNLEKQGQYEKALAIFETLDGFHDTDDHIEKITEILEAQRQLETERSFYQEGLEHQQRGEWEAARDAFIQAGSYEDTDDCFYEVIYQMDLENQYQKADAAFSEGDFDTALFLFGALGQYQDSSDRAAQAAQEQKQSWMKQSQSCTDPAKAALLKKLAGETDSADFTENQWYEAANALMQEGNEAAALLGFEKLGNFSDSDAKAQLCKEAIGQKEKYREASFFRAVRDYEKSNAIFKELGDYQDAAVLIVPKYKRIPTKQLRDDKTSEKSDVFTAPDGSRHQYQIFKGVHTWIEAREFCELLGGHLATLTTEEENQFVHSFMWDDCGFTTAYFGLSDEARKGNWIWVTGEPFEYTNWDSGEPSRCAKERYGMYFYKHKTGTWNDSHFYETAEVDPGCSFICEFDLP